MTASIQTVIRKRQDKRNLKLALEDHRTRVAKAQKIQLTTMQKIMNVIVHVLMALMVLYCLIPLIWLLFSSTIIRAHPVSVVSEYKTLPVSM